MTSLNNVYRQCKINKLKIKIILLCCLINKKITKYSNVKANLSGSIFLKTKTKIIKNTIFYLILKPQSLPIHKVNKLQQQIYIPYLLFRNNLALRVFKASIKIMMKIFKSTNKLSNNKLNRRGAINQPITNQFRVRNSI